MQVTTGKTYEYTPVVFDQREEEADVTNDVVSVLNEVRSMLREDTDKFTKYKVLS